MSLVLPAVVALGVAVLTPGTEVRRTIAMHETQSFRLVLLTNRFVHLVVEQGVTDLRVVVSAPDGHALGTYDQWEHGQELVSFLADRSGNYRVDVRTMGSPTRRVAYRIRFDTREYEPDDDRWIEAERLGTEARQFALEGGEGALREALARRTHALGLWQSLHERWSALKTSVGMGEVLYRLNQYDEAETTFRESLQAARAIEDRETEAEVLNNLAATDWARGNVSEALNLLDESLKIWRALRLAQGEATTLSNRGVLLWQAGEFDEARQHYSKALTIFRALGNRTREAYVLANMALVLETLGEHQDSLDSLGRVISLFRGVGDRLYEGQALVRRARLQLALGRRESALISARQGLAAISASGDRLAEADAREQLGRVSSALRDRNSARAEYEQALRLYREIGSRRGESDALHDLGLTYLDANDFPKALELFAQARQIRRDGQLRSLEAETLVRMAQTERLNGDLAQAHEHAQSAIAIAERLRAGVFERELRISYSSAIQRYYAEDIETLMALHRQQPNAGFDAQAFDVVERTKARVLLESLREGPTSATEGLRQRERELREELDYWSWQLWQQADHPPNNTTKVDQAKLQSLLERHEAAEADLRRADSRDSRFSQTVVLPLSEIRREVLDDRTLLFEYALGEERSYLWVIGATELAVSELPKRAEIERLARRFYTLVSTDPASQGRPGAASESRRLAASLGRILLPMQGLREARRIVVVADGMLNNVPFGALLAPGRSTPIVSTHELVVVPSSTTMALLHRTAATRQTPAKTLAVVADPVFDVGDTRVTQPSNVALPASTAPPARRLSRLPFSREEAERILSLVAPGQRMQALDFGANRSVVNSSVLSSYRYIHFATHAVRDDQRPNLSGIVLSLVDRQGQPQNGFVRLQDIASLRLHSDLVVLSACETALGKQRGGEGMLSLAHGFFSAGASRVLATLWKVDDEATADMMQYFYKSLLSGSPPATALRIAQQTMRRHTRWGNPFYWSGFVLQGDW